MKRIKDKINKYFNGSPCYAMSYTTMYKEFLKPNDFVVGVPTLKELGFNVFIYDNEYYIGTETDRLAYYQDKLNGTNPFYQTS